MTGRKLVGKLWTLVPEYNFTTRRWLLSYGEIISWHLKEHGGMQVNACYTKICGTELRMHKVNTKVESNMSMKEHDVVVQLTYDPLWKDQLCRSNEQPKA